MPPAIVFIYEISIMICPPVTLIMQQLAKHGMEVQSLHQHFRHTHTSLQKCTARSTSSTVVHSTHARMHTHIYNLLHLFSSAQFWTKHNRQRKQECNWRGSYALQATCMHSQFPTWGNHEPGSKCAALETCTDAGNPVQIVQMLGDKRYLDTYS